MAGLESSRRELQGLYAIKSIAELTGFKPNLLRAWERRYNFLEPQRKASGHRLYTEDDRRILMAVRSHLAEGRSIGEIAAVGREALLAENACARVELRRVPCAQGPCSPVVSGLIEQTVEASLNLDSRKLESLLDQAFATLSEGTVFEIFLVQVVRRIGELWSQGKASVATERLVSEAFCRRLYQHWVQVQPQAEGPSVLVACFPNEQHQMGALLVTCHLASAGADVKYLGSLPLLDLELACRKLNPDLALMSVTRPELFDVHRDGLAEIISRNKSTRFILGGLGVNSRKGGVARIGADTWSGEQTLKSLSVFLER